MTGSTQTIRFRFWRWLIRFIGVIVPRRFRARFRQEWEAELEYREELLARWDRLDWRNKLELLWRSLGAFWDALWLQRQRWEDEMIQDLRFGFRMLLKNPGFTLVAILTLALGIGANAALFSLVDALLLRTLPVRQPERLALFKRVEAGNRMIYDLPYSMFERLRNQPQVFSEVAANWLIERAETADSPGVDPGQVRVGMASGNYFSTLGVQAALGRTFTLDDNRAPGGHPVAVISHGYWERRFALAPDIIGRLNPGVTIAQAQAASQLIYQQGLLEEQGANLTPQQRQFIAQRRVELESAAMGYSAQRQALAQPLQLLAGLVGLALLAVCANVANLLLARSAAREREMAVRQALGAHRLRIARQLLTESLLLAALGGALGLLFAVWGSKLLAPALKGRNAVGGRGRFFLGKALVVAQVALSLALLVGAGLLARTLRNLRTQDVGFDRENLLLVWAAPVRTGRDVPALADFAQAVQSRLSSLPGVRSASVSNGG